MSQLRLALILAALCTLSVPALAASSAGLPGGYLRAGWGARAGALGNALVAGAEGPEAAYWDPAALGGQGRYALASSYDWMSLERQFNTAAIVIPWAVSGRSDAPTQVSPSAKNSVGVFAVSWTEFSLGNDFEGRTTDTASFYTFGDKQDEFSLSFGRNIVEWCQLGTTIKYYQHDLDVYHAQGWGLDLAARLILWPGLAVAVTGQDLGAQFRWNTGTVEAVPWTLRIGAWGPLWPHYWDLGLQVQEVENGALEGMLGSEFHLLNFIELRAGWMRQGLTLGGGLSLTTGALHLHVDYAYLPDPLALGPDQRLGIRVDF